MMIVARMCVDNVHISDYEHFLRGESKNVLSLGKQRTSNNSRLEWLSELPFSNPEYTCVGIVYQPHIEVQYAG